MFRRELSAGIAVAALVAAVAGCASYEPKPLAPEEVLRDLRAVRLEGPAPVEGAAPPSGIAPSYDPRLGISQDEAVAVALALNPDLRAFRREQGIAEGELVAAGVLANPELQVAWTYLDSFTHSLATSGFDVGVSWSPPRPGERDAKEARAGARIAEVRALVAAEEWRLATDARKAYAAACAAGERLRIAEAHVALQDRIRDLLRRKVELGLATRLEQNLLEVDYAEDLRERARLADEREEALLELDRLLGLPPGYDLALRVAGDPLAYRPVAVSATALESLMVERRPDLLAAREEYEQAEQSLRLAYIQRIPWFRFGPTFSRDELEGKIQSRFGVGVGIDLPLANMNEGEIAIAAARRERLRGAFVARVHAARAELHDALRRIRAQERLIRLFEETTRPALEAGAALVEAGVRSGDLDVAQLVASQDKALRGRREFVEAELAYWGAVHDLERAAGARVVELEKAKE